MIVPTLPRGNASLDALRPLLNVTRSVTGCIPLLRVGTISALCGNNQGKRYWSDSLHPWDDRLHSAITLESWNVIVR
jgi:hypothetical protein